MNAFSRLSEIIFSYESGAKKVSQNYSIHYNKNSIIVLFTKELNQLFFCLDVGKEDLMKVFR